MAEDGDGDAVIRLVRGDEPEPGVLVDYEDEARKVLLSIATDSKEPSQVRIMAAAAILGGRDH